MVFWGRFPSAEMEKTTVRQRLGLIIFGAILGLVCMELLLRAGGFIFLCYKGQLKNSFAKIPQTYRILCLGDSFTQGIGAGKGEDYPYQLQELLNSLYLPEKFIVINKGRAGQNSSELLADLDINLNIYGPDLVILLTGMNDGQNTHLHYRTLGKTDLISKYKSWISSLRVYKLMHILSMSFKEAQKRYFKGEGQNIKVSYSGRQKANLANDEEIRKLLITKDYEKLAGFLIERMDKDNKWKHINVAKLTNSPRIIERVITKGIEISPHDAWFRLTLAKLYWSQQRINEAEGQFGNILHENPRNKFIRFEFAEFYISQSRFLEAKKLLLDEIKLHGESERAKWLLSACADKKTIKYENGNYEGAVLPYYITEMNVTKIKKKIRDRGVSLIILSYPQGSRVSEQTIQDVFYVDNFEVFSKMPERERENLLSADNHHCNSNGYELIAKNTLECILKKVLRPLVSPAQLKQQ